MNDQATVYSGECLCGAVRYRLNVQAPRAMFLCHCSRCRKETGSIHGAKVFFPEGSIIWERGESLIKFFALPGTRKARNFCSACGCPLPLKADNGQIALPAGSLDDDSMLRPNAHIWCESRASWDKLAANAPQYEEYAPQDGAYRVAPNETLS